MNNSVEALIPFSEEHQGLLKLDVHLWWGSFSMGEKMDFVLLHCFREVQCQRFFTMGI